MNVTWSLIERVAPSMKAVQRAYYDVPITRYEKMTTPFRLRAVTDYETIVYETNGSLSATCTCKSEIVFCKHSLALLIAALTVENGTECPIELTPPKQKATRTVRRPDLLTLRTEQAKWLKQLASSSVKDVVKAAPELVAYYETAPDRVAFLQRFTDYLVEPFQVDRLEERLMANGWPLQWLARYERASFIQLAAWHNEQPTLKRYADYAIWLDEARGQLVQTIEYRPFRTAKGIIQSTERSTLVAHDWALEPFPLPRLRYETATWSEERNADALRTEAYGHRFAWLPIEQFGFAEGRAYIQTRNGTYRLAEQAVLLYIDAHWSLDCFGLIRYEMNGDVTWLSAYKEGQWLTLVTTPSADSLHVVAPIHYDVTLNRPTWTLSFTEAPSDWLALFEQEDEWEPLLSFALMRDYRDIRLLPYLFHLIRQSVHPLVSLATDLLLRYGTEIEALLVRELAEQIALDNEDWLHVYAKVAKEPLEWSRLKPHSRFAVFRVEAERGDWTHLADLFRGQRAFAEAAFEVACQYGADNDVISVAYVKFAFQSERCHEALLQRGGAVVELVWQAVQRKWDGRFEAHRARFYELFSRVMTDERLAYLQQQFTAPKQSQSLREQLFTLLLPHCHEWLVTWLNGQKVTRLSLAATLLLYDEATVYERLAPYLLPPTGTGEARLRAIEQRTSVAEQFHMLVTDGSSPLYEAIRALSWDERWLPIWLSFEWLDLLIDQVARPYNDYHCDLVRRAIWDAPYSYESRTIRALHKAIDWQFDDVVDLLEEVIVASDDAYMDVATMRRLCDRLVDEERKQLKNRLKPQMKVKRLQQLL